MRHCLGVVLVLLGLVSFGEQASAGKAGPEFRVNTTPAQGLKAAPVGCGTHQWWLCRDMDFGSSCLRATL